MMGATAVFCWMMLTASSPSMTTIFNAAAWPARIASDAMSSRVRMTLSIHQRLIEQVRKPPADIGPVGNLLNHHHHRQSRFGIDAIYRAVGTAPAERSHRLHAGGAVALGGFESVAEAEPVDRVQCANLVGRHQFHGAWREDAH